MKTLIASLLAVALTGCATTRERVQPHQETVDPGEDFYARLADVETGDDFLTAEKKIDGERLGAIEIPSGGFDCYWIDPDNYAYRAVRVRFLDWRVVEKGTGPAIPRKLDRLQAQTKLRLESMAFDVTVINPWVRERREAERLERIQTYIARHPDVLEDYREAMIAKRVVVGMPSPAVLLAWGNPARIHTTVHARGESQVWQYGEHGSRSLYFENEILQTIHHTTTTTTTTDD